MYLPHKMSISALAFMAAIAVLASCGGGVSSVSDTPSDQPSEVSTQYSSPPSQAEDSSNSADTVGDLVLLSSDSLGVGGTYTLTFVDTETGESDSRSFTLPDTGVINPTGNWRLPFNEDFTELAIMSDLQDGGYYGSVGYVGADAGYTEVATSQSSFEGESGFYAATFHNGQLKVMNTNYEWIDPSSGDVVATGSQIDDETSGRPDLYILGLVKDLDPDLTSGANRTTYQAFCGNFPVPEDFPTATGYTAQEYHDQLANTQEQAILDPDGDGLACTDEDEAFLSGETDYDYEPQTEFEQTWSGLVTQTMEDGTTLDFELEADLIPISDMTEDLLGEVVGETRQEGIDCNGVWVLEEVKVDYVVVEERITDGASYCVESTPITLTPQDDDSLEYYFLDSYGSVGEGVLALQGNGVPNGDPENGDGDELLPSEEMGELGMTELPDTGGPALLPLVGGLVLCIGILGVAAALTRGTR